MAVDVEFLDVRLAGANVAKSSSGLKNPDRKRLIISGKDNARNIWKLLGNP